MKQVTVTHTFVVADDAPEWAVDSIVGAMGVQIDENVVGHDDSLNERSIDTAFVRSTHTVEPMQPDFRERFLQYVLDARRAHVPETIFGVLERSALREWLLTYGPDGNQMSEDIARWFPDLTASVADEVMTGDTEKEVLTLSNQHDEDDDGEYMGELARFTPMLDALHKGGKDSPIDDVEVWENGNLLLLVIKPEIGLCLGVADYVEEHWDVCLYINHDNSAGGDRRQFGEGDETLDHWINITDTLGHVPVNDGDPDQQQEIARRILYYLTHDEPFKSHQDELYEKYTRDVMVYEPQFRVARRPDGNFEVTVDFGDDMGYTHSRGRFDNEEYDYSEQAPGFPETTALANLLTYPATFVIDGEGQFIEGEGV